MLSDTQRIKMMECPDHPVDIVIDSDAYNEIDDQYAISYALHVPEKINVKAIYAAPFFNERSSGPADGMEKSFQEILKLLQLSEMEVPVFRGSEEYLHDEKTPIFSTAASDLAKRAMNYSSENPLYVIAIAAITNIASALLMQPSIADRIVIVWLGGNSLEFPDNREFNCMQDVTAARVVFQSGAPLIILPCMGVVSAFTISGPELHYWLDKKSPLCEYLVQHTEEAANEYAKGKVWSRPIWDVTAVAWILNEKDHFMRSKLIHTPIPQYDHHYSIDFTRPLCRYVFFIHRDALFEDLFYHLSK